MKKYLPDLFFFNQPFAEREQHIKYKIDFLSSVFLLAAMMAFGMGFYRWRFSPLMGSLDFGFAVISVALLFYLKRHREKVETISTVALLLCFLLFAALYLLAPYNPMRMSLFFLLTAAAFYLKGRRTGLRWLLLILFFIVTGHWLPGFNTGYSHIDLVTTCLYLIALFVIFWNYEAVREGQFRREREHELQSRIDERWRLALEGIGDAVWDWDLQARTIQYSRSYAEMLGYSADEIGHKAAVLENLLHPEDKASAIGHMKAYLVSEFVGGQCVSEQRLRCKDGSYKWILCRGRVTQWDANGRPQRMLGTHTDITERKLMEQALRDNNEHLRSIFENIPTIAVQGYTRDGTILYWNPASERVYGYSREEAMGGNLFDLIIPEQMREQILQKIQEVAQSGVGTPVEELLLRRKDGTPVSVYSSSVVVRLPGQEAILYCLDVDLSERKEHERQLEHIAHYDALTGVPNRVLLADRMVQALARAKREKGLMAVCYLDLDGFKPVNDNFGHEVGDRVLVEITRRIKEVIREDDTVARLGGDEFVVLLVGMQATEECVGSLNRLLDRIHQPIEVLGNAVSVSASIGVSLYPEDEQDADTLLRHADQAMYVAKQSGKNRYHLYDAANDLRARSHHELLKQIRHGLANNEFELYYQPKVELRTRRLAGVEALLRWHHPQRGLLLPGEFLRLIENTELDIVLGEWVIGSALAQMRQWRHNGIEIEVSINISAYHLQSADFVVSLQSQMQYCCPKQCVHCLQIEVLETAALEDISRVSAIINACRSFGVGFALDDFGTGYSSLTYLSQLDVDTLKIDQSFVRDMLEDKGEHAIVLGIIALAHAFERGIVAEGVETEAHYQALLAIGCEVGQGNGIARPMHADELIRWRDSFSSLTAVSYVRY